MSEEGVHREGEAVVPMRDEKVPKAALACRDLFRFGFVSKCENSAEEGCGAYER